MDNLKKPTLDDVADINLRFKNLINISSRTESLFKKMFKSVKSSKEEEDLNNLLNFVNLFKNELLKIRDIISEIDPEYLTERFTDFMLETGMFDWAEESVITSNDVLTMLVITDDIKDMIENSSLFNMENE